MGNSIYTIKHKATNRFLEGLLEDEDKDFSVATRSEWLPDNLYRQWIIKSFGGDDYTIQNNSKEYNYH